jgi:hypothetical protein
VVPRRPGRARLSTKPAPTGSVTCTKTIGTVRVASSSGPVVELPDAKMALGRTRRHACKLGLEDIVSKRKGSAYRSGRSPDWVKMKNPDAPAVQRRAEINVGRNRDVARC